MKFIDEVKIIIIGGKGGDGKISFLREKFKPKGGPNGGNGGDGGNIYFVSDHNIPSLLNYTNKRIYKASNGDDGKKFNKNGKNAKNLFLKVPLGTIIYDEINKIYLSDLTINNQKILLSKGGSGGKGNTIYKSSINRSPKKNTLGKLGECKHLYIELKLLSDIGLFGMPNVGKSTFLSIISNALPKISYYPFTTLYPKLGIVYDIKNKYIISDIPGIIKNSNKGIGLGIKFLKHLQRTKIILHIIDISKIKKNYILDSINIVKELKKFNFSLYKKNRWIILNKIDNISKNKIDIIKNIIKKYTNNKNIYEISCIKKKYINKLLILIFNFLRNYKYVRI